jgi:two-component system cell cycle response regulator CtrA
MRILAIDGNRLWSQALRDMLISEGFRVHLCKSGDEAVELTKTYEYDAIVVARAPSGASIGEIIKQLRVARVATAILALSDDENVSSRVVALAQGADDCLSKPYHRDELSARLRAIIRRSRAHPQSIIRIGKMEINLETREVRIADRAIHMTKSEYQTLELLALRKGKTVGKQTIFESLYDGHDDDPEEKIINVFVSKIRRKIAAASQGENYIATTYGGGYRLSEPAAYAA